MVACWLLSGLLAVAPARAGGPRQHPPADALAQAQRAIAHNDFAQAADLLRRFLAGRPAAGPRAEAELELGYAEAGRDHPRRAIAAYQAGLKAQPKHFAGQLNLGLLFLKTQQPQAALAPLEAASRLRPKDPKPWFELGRAHEALGQSNEAVAAYQRAAALAPATAGAGPSAAPPHSPLTTAAAFDAGILLLHAGQNAQAAEMLAMVTQREPQDAEAQKALADAYARRGELKKAALALRAYLALRPGDEAAQRRMAGLLARENDPRSAQEQLEAELRRAPDDAAARRQLAEMQMAAKAYPAAAANYGLLARAQPASAERQYDWGHALLLSGQYAQALGPLQAAVRLDAHLAPGWWDLGFAAYQVKQYGPAAEALEHYAELAGGGGPVDFLRAVCWDHLGHYHRAIAQYEAFLAADKDQHYNEDFKARHRLITLRRIVAGH